MKHDLLSRFLLALLLVLAMAAGVSHAQGPLGTAFTYQGQIKQDGEPVTATCDMRFGLWTSATGGALVGSLLERPGVVVTDGLFTVSDLDFGAGAFNGGSRWLEISVSCPSGTGYTTLTPRQPITPAPYSIYSLGVPWSGIAGMPAGFADGTDNDTAYSVSTGMAISGTQLSVSVPFQLPQGCTNGYIPKWDNTSGTWVCDPGTGTTYSAGNGLNLVGTTFSVLYGGNGSATAVSRSDHDHDVRYYTETEMQTGGSAALHWSNLTNVPAGFGDGADNDTTYSAGAGLALTATTFSANWGGNGAATTISRSDHEHDARYYTETELSTDTAAQVHWNNLVNIPVDLADGDHNTTYTAGAGLALAGTQFAVDPLYQLPQGCTNNYIAKWDAINDLWICDPGTGTTYSAGTGLSLGGTTFSVNWGGNGAATTVSRSDHEHDARYYTETELSTDTAAQVHWNNLTNVPAGLADGDNDTTYTAGSGLNLAAGQFSVNTGTIQARVGSTCGVGSSIRAINADGTVVCDSGVPIGMVIDWWRPRPTDPLPYGYVVCDGAVVNDPSSPINGTVLPNLVDRFVRGLTDLGALPNEGYTTGGADTHDHTVDLPNHNHSINHDHGAITFWSGAPDATYSVAYAWGVLSFSGSATNHWHQTTVDLPNHAGTSGDHDPAPITVNASNVPAYVGLLKLCRIK